MVRYFATRTPIWWNRGNEVKPNYEEFQALQWDELNNFNVTWINEMTIEVILTRGAEFELLNIVDKRDVTYWYLESILNVTATTKKCRFSLDLWCTYILSGKITLPYLQTNRVHFKTGRWDFQAAFNDFTKIAPYGYIDINKDLRQLKGQYYTLDNARLINNPVFNASTAEKPRKFLYHYLSTYYVFRSKNNGIIAIPILLEKSSAIDLNTVQDLQQDIKDIPPEKIFFRWNSDSLRNQPIYVLNDYRNLEYLKNRTKDYPNSSLGEFIGIFNGPNFWRFNGYFYWSGLQGMNKTVKMPNFIPISGQHTGGTLDYVKGFAGLMIPADMIWIRPINPYDNRDLVERSCRQGLGWWGNPENNAALFFGKWIVFTNYFNIITNKEAFSLQTEVPSFSDPYKEWLAQSKNQRDMGLNVANQQLGMGIVNGLFGISGIGVTQANSAGSNWGNINPLSTMQSALSGFTNGLMSLIRTGLQFQNTRRQIANQMADMRQALDTKMIPGDILHLKNYVMFWELANNKNNRRYIECGDILSANPNDWAGEVIFGSLHQDPNNLYNFFGWETQYHKDNNTNIQQIRSTYLKYAEDLKTLSLQRAIISPIIREALVVLLINGVRIATKAEVENNFA